MKKLIVGLSIVAILAVVVVLFTNSRVSGPEGKKAATEMSKSGKCSASCSQDKAKETKSEVAEAETAAVNAEAEKPCCKEAGSMKKGCEETACPMKTAEKK